MRPALLLLAVAASAVSLARADAPAETVALGKHFRVVCHWADAREAPQALAAVEAIWAPATEAFGPAPASSRPSDVHLYRTVADYERAEKALTGGRFTRNQAFTHHPTRSAHVALQPECSDTTLRAIGLPRLTLRLLAHEACHVVRLGAMPNFATHPRWYADGAALWIADGAMIANGWSTGFAEDPLTSTDVVRCREAAERGKVTVERILADDLDALDLYVRYAAKTCLFHCLADTRKAAFAAFLAAARGVRGNEDVPTRLRAALPPCTDAELLAWLRARKTAWEESHRSLELRGAEWVQIAFPDTNAVAWRTDAAPASFALRGEVEVLAGRDRQMNVLLGRHDDGWLTISLRPDQTVTLFRYTTTDDRWETLAQASVESFALGWRTDFDVACRDGSLSVRLGGVEVLRHPLDGLDPSGPWGLGAQAGSSGVWSHVRLER